MKSAGSVLFCFFLLLLLLLFSLHFIMDITPQMHNDNFKNSFIREGTFRVSSIDWFYSLHKVKRCRNFQIEDMKGTFIFRLTIIILTVVIKLILSGFFLERFQRYHLSTSLVSNLSAWSTRRKGSICFDAATAKVFATLPTLQTFFTDSAFLSTVKFAESRIKSQF